MYPYGIRHILTQKSWQNYICSFHECNPKITSFSLDRRIIYCARNIKINEWLYDYRKVHNAWSRALTTHYTFKSAIFERVNIKIFSKVLG